MMSRQQFEHPGAGMLREDAVNGAPQDVSKPGICSNSNCREEAKTCTKN